MERFGVHDAGRAAGVAYQAARGRGGRCPGGDGAGDPLANQPRGGCLLALSWGGVLRDGVHQADGAGITNDAPAAQRKHNAGRVQIAVDSQTRAGVRRGVVRQGQPSVEFHDFSGQSFEELTLIIDSSAKVTSHFARSQHERGRMGAESDGARARRLPAGSVEARPAGVFNVPGHGSGPAWSIARQPQEPPDAHAAALDHFLLPNTQEAQNARHRAPPTHHRRATRCRPCGCGGRPAVRSAGCRAVIVPRPEAGNRKPPPIVASCATRSPMVRRSWPMVRHSVQSGRPRGPAAAPVGPFCGRSWPIVADLVPVPVVTPGFLTRISADRTVRYVDTLFPIRYKK